ncbi:Hypothetical protein FKW44_016813 [Caligus rogercresseyi]|uniref:Uncharacterized protein n=1 Tax=Caligus rogercresseyi TaxID=217165 RepID=A0A7T8H2N7_CALRO|nr:Hypothetical protein FKW44_016813 [Caligus rogercresseyi]
MAERTQLFSIINKPFQGHSISSLPSSFTSTDIGGWLKNAPSLHHFQDRLQ